MVVADGLPRLSYPTFADVVLIVCYLAATALIVVSIAVRKTEAARGSERAKRVDQWARRLFPVVVATILGVTALVLWR